MRHIFFKQNIFCNFLILFKKAAYQAAGNEQLIIVRVYLLKPT